MSTEVGCSTKPTLSDERDVVEILGVPIDRLDMTDSLARIEAFIVSGKPNLHVVVNASKLVMLKKDKHLADVVRSCDLVNADGQSVVWASRLLGCALPERVAGIDLMTELLRRSSKTGYRVYFLGARKEVVAKMIDRCHREFEGLRVAGWHSGYFEMGEELHVLADIRSSRPDILFVALGSPYQEYWLERNYVALGVPFCMGVGGSFDVLAGDLRRAPQWMQKHGLEWLFRLLQEPRRMWKRYLKSNLAFALLVCTQVLSTSRRSRDELTGRRL